MLTNQNFIKVFFLETHVERISNLQDIKKAKLDREIGLFLYEDMTLGRRFEDKCADCLLYTSPSPRDRTRSRMPSSA